MTKYTFPITIPASGGGNRVNVATAAIAAGAVIQGYRTLYSNTYLPAAKLFFQMKAGDSGTAFIGGATVDQTGAGSDYQITSNAALPGGTAAVESQTDSNTVDLSQYYVHGTIPGDIVDVSYQQN
jgi:hypothetical protein